MSLDNSAQPIVSQSHECGQFDSIMVTKIYESQQYAGKLFSLVATQESVSATKIRSAL